MARGTGSDACTTGRSTFKGPFAFDFLKNKRSILEPLKTSGCHGSSMCSYRSQAFAESQRTKLMWPTTHINGISVCNNSWYCAKSAVRMKWTSCAKQLKPQHCRCSSKIFSHQTSNLKIHASIDLLSRVLMMYRATAVKWACLVLVKWDVLRKEPATPDEATPDEATPDEASPDVAMIGVHTLPFNQSPFSWLPFQYRALPVFWRNLPQSTCLDRSSVLPWQGLLFVPDSDADLLPWQLPRRVWSQLMSVHCLREEAWAQNVSDVLVSSFKMQTNRLILVGPHSSLGSVAVVKPVVLVCVLQGFCSESWFWTAGWDQQKECQCSGQKVYQYIFFLALTCQSGEWSVH